MMSNSSGSGDDRLRGRKDPRRRRPKRVQRPGARKVYPPGERSEISPVGRDSRVGDRHAEARIVHTVGPVIQVHSTRLRSLVDTFLRNTSRVQTAFSALLQGSDGGFQGEMEEVMLAHVEQEKCSAALAIMRDRKWLIHSSNPQALERTLATVPADMNPWRIEGEAQIVKLALDHGRLRSLHVGELFDCLSLETSPRKTAHGPGGHHRFAQPSDVPRLDEYAVEFEKAVGWPPPCNWKKLIAENRILLGMVEGTVASVAVRSADTLDRILIEGVYTFKAFRRRGLARRLVAALVKQAAGRGQAAQAIVEKGNRPVLALLEGLQFHKTTDYLIVFLGSPGGDIENSAGTELK